MIIIGVRDGLRLIQDTFLFQICASKPSASFIKIWQYKE